MLVLHRVAAIVFTAALLVACSPKLALPPDALIDCSGGQACPNGLVCRATIGRCVDPNATTEDPPAVSGTPSVTPPRGSKGTPFSIAFDATKPLASAPTMEVQIQDQVFSASLVASQSSGQHYVFQYVATGNEPEGQADCLVTMVDSAGNTAKGLPVGKFSLDFSAPTATAVVQYLAAPGNPLGSAITKATAGTVVRVTVYSNETLSASKAPVLTASNGADAIDTFTQVDSTDRTKTFQATIPAGLPDSPGQYVPSVSGWSDDLGNSGTVVLTDAPIEVETTTPALLVAQAQVEYLRSPWGNQTPDAADGGSALPDGGFAFPGGPYFAIAPTDSLSSDQTLPANTFQLSGGAAITRVRFWSSASLENFLGEATPQSSGAWPRARLAALDLPSLYVTALDEAGNESAPVELANAEWVATPRIPSVGTSPNLAEWAPNTSPAISRESFESTVIGGSELSGTDTDGVLARAEGTWRRRVGPAAVPGTRADQAMAYDSARGRVVMFGGFSGSRLNDIWEWDGSTWADKTPAGDKPSARNGAMIAYDTVRGRVILFGGLEVSGPPFDQNVWEWDGTSWAVRPTAGPQPAPRHHGMAAYDSRRGKLVLFGGVDASNANTYFNDVWEWDSRTATWTNRTPATLPPAWPTARKEAGMAYDSLRGEVVLFGGFTNPNSVNDLWEWDGASGTWTDRTPGTLPSNWPGIRSWFGMTYDSQRHVTVVAGGGGDYSTWEWDGSSWTEKRDPSFVGPANRNAFMLAYDSVHRRVVLAGGSNGSSILGDTWLFDGTKWGQIPTVGQSAPAGRFFHTMVYDSDRDVMMVFGGASATLNYMQDLWEWDGHGGIWTNRTPATLPASWPTGRQQAAMAYDSGRKVTVLFGGVGGGDQNDLLEWDASNATWTDRTPATLPPSWPTRRHGATMVYDVGRGISVLFGGRDYNGADSDELWEWDGANGVWTDRTPSTRPASWPTGRDGAAMAYDSSTGKVFLFGGFAGGQPVQDLWEWNGSSGTWTNLTPSPLPAAWPAIRDEHAMAYDSARQRLVLSGGTTGPQTYADVWEWDGTSWTDRTPTGLEPSPLSGHTMAFDATRGVTVLFGGNVGGQHRNDVWEWSLDPNRQPEVQLTATGAAPGLGTVTGLRVRARCGATSPTLSGQDGAELYGWSNGLGVLAPEGWTPLANNAASVSTSVPYLADPTAALLDWTAGSQDEAQQYVLSADAQAAFQCRPQGSSGTGVPEATVAADYLEVRVKYLAP